MTLRHLCVGAVAAIAASTLSLAAQAAPLSVAAGDLKTVAAENAVVEKAAYRCRWRNGKRFCRWVSNVPGVLAFNTTSLEAALRAAASSVPTP